MHTAILSFLLAIAFANKAVASSECTSFYQQPVWPKEAIEAKDSNDLELLEYVTKPTRRDGTRVEEWLTEQFLILHQDQPVFEYYGDFQKPDQKHIMWSTTKSLINTLVGLAVKDKKISLSDPVTKYLPELSQFSEVTIDHLLTFSSGILWDETYEESIFPNESAANGLLYGPAINDIRAYYKRFKLTKEPGTFWRYSTGDSTLLSVILKAVYKDEYDDILWKRIFHPLGISSVTIESGKNGVYLLGSSAFMSARDLAKIGLFYLHRGCINKVQGSLLPTKGEIEEELGLDWYDFTMKPNQALLNRIHGEVPWPDQDARHFWINAPKEQTGLEKPYPAAPSGILIGMGHWGQRLYIIPEWEIVAVRFSNDRTPEYWKDEIFFEKLKKWYETRVESQDNQTRTP